MKYNTLITALFSLLLLTTACGGGSESANGDLASKKAKLKELKSDLQKVSKEIQKLETEIASLDTSRSEEDAIVPVKISKVTLRDFKHFVKVQGQIEADNLIMVSPQVPGTIRRVHVKNGQKVSKGQLLAELDADALRSQLGPMETQLDLATTLFEKQKSLWERKIGSEMQYLQAKNNKESMEKSIESVKAQLRMYTLRAPISGTIDMLTMKAGQAAAPGNPVCLIVNLSELVFKADISESYIPNISKGDNVSIYLPTIDQEVEAKVTNMSQTINPVNRTISVEVNLPPNNKMLKANMMGELSINDISREEAAAISLSYIRKSSKGQYVYKAKKNPEGDWIAQQVPIQSGMSYDGDVEITSGLDGGDLLIVEGFQALSDGQKIKFEDSGSN